MRIIRFTVNWLFVLSFGFWLGFAITLVIITLVATDAFHKSLTDPHALGKKWFWDINDNDYR